MGQLFLCCPAPRFFTNQTQSKRIRETWPKKKYHTFKLRLIYINKWLHSSLTQKSSEMRMRFSSMNPNADVLHSFCKLNYTVHFGHMYYLHTISFTNQMKLKQCWRIINRVLQTNLLKVLIKESNKNNFSLKF